ncbi:fumarylacetoacetate hydrolase family protein [Ectobacillus funiculus]
MRLLHIVKNEELRLAIFTEQGVLDLAEAGEVFNFSLPQTLKQVIIQGEEGLAKIEEITNKAMSQRKDLFRQEESITFGPSVDSPEKIICIGLNYISHAEESKMKVPTEPIVFSKFSNALSAHQQIVELPNNAEKYDYEAELVVIIGKEARNITEEEAPNYIFGYTIGNDLSARDLQFKTGQWLIGKTLDGFAPVGPYTVPSKFIGNPHNLDIECRVNGQVCQKANTKDMIFNCYKIISYLSEYMTLKPGDVIFTGTPEGVILGYPEGEQAWLTSQDEVTISIDKLGTLRNTLS